MGHAVTAMYLYCGAADVFAETGDETLFDALTRIWQDVIEKKMYVTGAVGTLHFGTSIRWDDVHEAFGLSYQLPNATAYNETCANIGNAMFNWRLLQIIGDAKFAEVVERVLYNSALSPVSVDGKRFFYTNPLRFYGKDHRLLSNDEYERWHTYTCYCCPTQVARSIAWYQNWAYSLSEDGIWVHLYSGNKLDTQLTGGGTLRLSMETDYPWSGDICLRVVDAPERKISIRLRIPEWANGTVIVINGEIVDEIIKSGTYFSIERIWVPDDEVLITFPMVVRLLKSHPKVEENRNHFAVMRGPVVYCLESVDLPDGVNLSEVHLPRGVQFSVNHQPYFLGGVSVLKAEVVRIFEDVFENSLYAKSGQESAEKILIRMIPYHVWANR